MRKSNVCLCTLVVRQLLGGGGAEGLLEGCGWSNRRCWIPCSTAGSPASPLGHFWSLPINQLIMPAQQKTSPSSSAYWSPTSEGAESALGRGSAGQGGWVNLTHTHPPQQQPWTTSGRAMKPHPEKNLQTPSERAYPFLQTHRRPNKQHRGWQGKRSEDKRTESSD